MNNEATKYIDNIKHALAQHAVCSIARDAASKYPNPNRVARGASNKIPAITQQLQQPAAPVVPDATAQLMTLVKDIDARLKKANL